MLIFGWNDSWITKMFLSIIEIHFFAAVFIAFQPFFSIQLNYINKYITTRIIFYDLYLIDPTDDSDLQSTIRVPTPDEIPILKSKYIMKLKTK